MELNDVCDKVIYEADTDVSLAKMTNMDKIVYAIDNRLYLRFYYSGKGSGKKGVVKSGYRYVAVHTIGKLQTGRLGILGYWENGTSKSLRDPRWRTYRMDRVSLIELTLEPFVTAPGYKRDARQFISIVYQVGNYRIKSKNKPVKKDKANQK